MTNYEQQAQEFLQKTNTTFEAKFLKNDFHFDGDKEKRDIYEITLSRGDRKMVFNFGQSIVKSGFYAKTNRGHRADLDRALLNSPKHKQHLEASIKMFAGWGRIKGDEIHRPEAPTAYDVLACLTKYDVGTLENFCGEFGYDLDSKKAEKTYSAVKKEFADVQRLWTDSEIELLQEII